MNYINEYVSKIKSGEIVTGQKIKNIYYKLSDQQSGAWVFDEALANRAINFIEKFCKQSKGEWIGKSVELMLFQKAYIAALFGFVHKDTGIRRFKETLFLVARKNGKSTLLSGILLYMLVADGEGGSECYTVATKKDQAKITFNESVNMVKQSPYLSKHLKKRKTDIYFPLTFGKFEALASDSNSLDGLNSHCVVFDELHAIKDRNLYEVMKQSMSARRQPLLVMITTAGTVRECIYDDIYDYANKVLDGLIEDERFLPVLYELDEISEWTNFKCWEKANPGLGTIKKLEDISEKVQRAKSSAQDLNGILCKDFNIKSNTANAWLPFDVINNEETFNIEDLKGSYAIGGCDLSATTDLTCATLLIMKSGSNKKYVHQMYFLPDALLDKRQEEDKIPYRIWQKRGLLVACEGNQVSFSDVTKWFLKMREELDIIPLWIYYDRALSAYWVEEMVSNGFNMEKCAQGAYTFNQPMRTMEADLRDKLINYSNNPVLKWCLSNVTVKTDENDMQRPVKGRNQRARIDGMVSLLDAYVGLCDKYQDYINML